jgi:toxin ParE1/3/4
LKPAHLRPRAEADLIEAARYYAQDGGLSPGERMFDAAIAALEPIERMPSVGSARLGLLCDIPGLRCWRVAGFPMTWLYFEASDHLDVVRLVGDRQDILAILQDAG